MREDEKVGRTCFTGKFYHFPPQLQLKTPFHSSRPTTNKETVDSNQFLKPVEENKILKLCDLIVFRFGF